MFSSNSWKITYTGTGRYQNFWGILKCLSEDSTVPYLKPPENWTLIQNNRWGLRWIECSSHIPVMPDSHWFQKSLSTRGIRYGFCFELLWERPGLDNPLPHLSRPWAMMLIWRNQLLIDQSKFPHQIATARLTPGIFHSFIVVVIRKVLVHCCPINPPKHELLIPLDGFATALDYH